MSDEDTGRPPGMEARRRRCVSCDEEISEKAALCPHCGSVQNRLRYVFRWTGVIGGRGEHVFTVVGLVATPAFLAWTLIASFRHQAWLNVMVAQEIQRQRADDPPPTQGPKETERTA